MKKIFAIGIALLTLVSCNMDFYSSDAMTSSALKENPSAAEYTTDGIYALFKDNLDRLNILFIIMIIAGVAGLEVSTVIG